MKTFSHSSARPIRVLLVDDASRVRRELHQLLELTNEILVVGEAEDGAQAVQMAQQLTPDVVVMDLAMPMMDGFEATRQIKTASPEMRVVILSVHSSQQGQERARSLGADRFIIKGVDYKELFDAILGKNEPTKSEKGE